MKKILLLLFLIPIQVFAADVGEVLTKLGYNETSKVLLFYTDFVTDDNSSYLFDSYWVFAVEVNGEKEILKKCYLYVKNRQRGVRDSLAVGAFWPESFYGVYLDTDDGEEKVEDWYLSWNLVGNDTVIPPKKEKVFVFTLDWDAKKVSDSGSFSSRKAVTRALMFKEFKQGKRIEKGVTRWFQRRKVLENLKLLYCGLTQEEIYGSQETK